MGGCLSLQPSHEELVRRAVRERLYRDVPRRMREYERRQDWSASMMQNRQECPGCCCVCLYWLQVLVLAIPECAFRIAFLWFGLCVLYLCYLLTFEPCWKDPKSDEQSCLVRAMLAQGATVQGYLMLLAALVDVLCEPNGDMLYVYEPVHLKRPQKQHETGERFLLSLCMPDGVDSASVRVVAKNMLFAFSGPRGCCPGLWCPCLPDNCGTMERQMTQAWASVKEQQTKRTLAFYRAEYHVDDFEQLVQNEVARELGHEMPHRANPSANSADPVVIPVQTQPGRSSGAAAPAARSARDEQRRQEPLDREENKQHHAAAAAVLSTAAGAASSALAWAAKQQQNQQNANNNRRQR